MAKLSVYLPPFSPDYSGVSSVLFDLNTVTAMHDASGCTGNYTGYDEPRWYGSKSPIYCSGMREIDAVMGDDEKLLVKMEAAGRDLKPDLFALVGSPVPMVIGCDLDGVAHELESRTGIPSFGFDTTGTAYYDRGVALATLALLRRFSSPMKKKDGLVNIVGATPIDFGVSNNIQLLKAYLKELGYTVNATLSMGYTLEDVKNAGQAQANIAVSRAGYLIAREMEKMFGQPYLCGLPVGESGSKVFSDTLGYVCRNAVSQILHSPDSACEGVLVIGEQVQANSIRHALASDFGIENVSVGCLFDKEDALSLSQDLDLASEAELCKALRDPRFHTIVADPLLAPMAPGKDFISIAHYAVSSKIGVKDTVSVIGEHFNQFWQAAVEMHTKKSS